jgi:hypothetical protein
MQRLYIAVLSAALFALVGCGDDYGEPCQLPGSVSVEAYCGSTVAEEGDSTATCVFTNSAECSSRMCAQYIGSSNYCTIECNSDEPSSCPGTSFCQAVPASDLGFCVPASIQSEVE